MIRRVALLSFLVAVVAGLGVVATPSEVNACSLSPIEPDERVETFASQSTATVVGEAVDETQTAEYLYSAEIQVVASLAGSASGSLSIDGLGWPFECGSGPRLAAGERFLLFVTDEPLFGAVDDDEGWQLAALGQGIYVVEDGDAFYYGQLNDPRQREPVGSAEALIREVGEALDSDAAEVERAVTFANGGALPPLVAEQESNPIAVWGSVGVGAMAVAILGGWYVRGRSRRGG